MNALKKNVDVKKNAFGCRSGLGNSLKRGTAFKLGVVSVLAILGSVCNEVVSGQEYSSSHVAWTTQDGHVAVDLSSKTLIGKSNHIRQTSTFVQDAMNDDVNSLPQYDQDLEDPSQYGTHDMDAELLDPSLEEPHTESNVSQSVTPLAPPASPTQPVEPQHSLVPSANVSSPASVLSTEVKTYPQSSVNGNNSSNARPGTFSNSASNTSLYSTNPYSRFGQTEYNPNLFNGGGNYSVNGYRQTPPEVAYGQSLCGSSCYDGQCGYGGCGVFGSLLDNTQLEAGVLSMRSPLDFEDDGNAGANLALNWGSSRPAIFGLNLQAGARATFTDYNGVSSNGFKTDDSRSQVFWTAGVYFRTPMCSDGWSGGIVYDSLIEDYYREYDLSQLRAELSYNFTNFCEIGFRGAFSLNEDWCDFLKMDDDLCVEAKATATSYYTLFLRKRFLEGAEAMIYGGATEWSEGLIGASAEAPLSDSFAIRGAASYVFPTDRGLTHREEETWNMSMGFVWYLGGNARSGVDSQRPLFDVADNGSFIQNFLR